MKAILLLLVISSSFGAEIGVKEVYKMAKYAYDVYGPEATLKKTYEGSYVFSVRKVQVLVHGNVVAVRGTANVINALQDLEYLKTKNHTLGIRVHRGFNTDSRKVFTILKNLLKKDVKYFITGHSLGGAIAAVVSLYMFREGYQVENCVTFGQPMFTNYQGVWEYEGKFGFLRVVRNGDPVPNVPPKTLLSLLHGEYTHMGDLWFMTPEGIARQSYLVGDNHDFGWDLLEHLGDERIKNHSMVNYVKDLKYFLRR